jgi:cellulose synthase (UDP-forming)
MQFLEVHMNPETNREKRVEKFRRVVAVIGVIVTLYYLYWRVTETLNPNALAFSWALYGAEVFGAITTFLFYFMVWKPRTRIAPPPLTGKSVDVLIPTKSESVEVLRKTILACRDLKYPHQTMVLDDGERPEVQTLCEELGCRYLARPSHEGAKAGNLNYGLQHSTAEFVVVFDADHVPLPNFIDRTIGYFQDEKVAFVQTPQEFYNIDSFQHRTDKKKKYIWGEQYLFFSLIQPGKDHWNSAYFVGSCAILRRKALDECGEGFATETITEDMLTSLRIHAKGWSSVYHNENLAYGIAAETILPFHVQRQRWGVGNWQILWKANPLFLRGLTFAQRLNYLSSMIYPLEGFQKIIFYATPPIALFTGVLPMKALDVTYLAHFIPYFVISIFSFNEMARGYGGQIMLEQFSMGKYFTYIKSVWLFFLPKERAKFKVTPKGEGTTVPFSFIIPQFIVLLASFIAILFGVIQLLIGQRSDDFVIAVNCFWALYNSGLAVAILQYDYKKLFQRRNRFRIPDAIPCLICETASKDSEEPRDCSLGIVDDLTEDGASLILIGQVLIGKQLDLTLCLGNDKVSVKGSVMRQQSSTALSYTISNLGIRFHDTPQGTRDLLSRYMHEAAISKSMREYATKYKTYLERRFQAKHHFKERAYRALAYLPCKVVTHDRKAYYGVIKDISETGTLVAMMRQVPTGTDLSVQVVLGRDTLPLMGTVVRQLESISQDFPEYVAGIRLSENSRPNVAKLLTLADEIGGFILD